ncbi:MAG: sugar phosphate isomerase/epimerase [Oscillospiraceae bacterium]|nr:sugar phosphate isomerase/epimerase [Oscillospiraceae bacterium]
MKKEKLFISTIAEDAVPVAREYGLGLEIAEYCTAWNMDDRFAQTDAAVRSKLDGIPNRVFHAPFNELFPCAIDPKARELAAYRYRQAIDLAKGYSAAKVIIHGGFHPEIYYPVWYTGESVRFWQEFLKEDPGVEIVLENVLEDEPGMLLDIVKRVENPRIRLCLDIGHVNAYSRISAMDWLEACAGCISHFHIHNNDGSRDTHSDLNRGTVLVKELLDRAEVLCPDATYTLEVTGARPSVRWLLG